MVLQGWISTHPGLTSDSLQLSLEAMLATGVTACLPTIITGSETHLHTCFSALEKARKSPLD